VTRAQYPHTEDGMALSLTAIPPMKDGQQVCFKGTNRLMRLRNDTPTYHTERWGRIGCDDEQL
ncbi:hypothetical protein THOM_1348, partial [Trachipleistophora hominis]